MSWTLQSWDVEVKQLSDLVAAVAALMLDWNFEDLKMERGSGHVGNMIREPFCIRYELREMYVDSFNYFNFELIYGICFDRVLV